MRKARMNTTMVVSRGPLPNRKSLIRCATFGSFLHFRSDRSPLGKSIQKATEVLRIEENDHHDQHGFSRQQRIRWHPQGIHR
jgi:hypothetical protein